MAKPAGQTRQTKIRGSSPHGPVRGGRRLWSLVASRPPPETLVDNLGTLKETDHDLTSREGFAAGAFSVSFLLGAEQTGGDDDQRSEPRRCHARDCPAQFAPWDAESWAAHRNSADRRRFRAERVRRWRRGSATASVNKWCCRAGGLLGLSSGVL